MTTNTPERIQIIVPHRLHCPHCGAQHTDNASPSGKIDWSKRAHKTHECKVCGGLFDVFVRGT